MYKLRKLFFIIGLSYVWLNSPVYSQALNMGLTQDNTPVINNSQPNTQNFVTTVTKRYQDNMTQLYQQLMDQAKKNPPLPPPPTGGVVDNNFNNDGSTNLSSGTNTANTNQNNQPNARVMTQAPASLSSPPSSYFGGQTPSSPSNAQPSPTKPGLNVTY